MAVNWHNKDFDSKYSRCTESPGISQLFGGATQNTEKSRQFAGQTNKQRTGTLMPHNNEFEIQYKKGPTVSEKMNEQSQKVNYDQTIEKARDNDKLRYIQQHHKRENYKANIQQQMAKTSARRQEEKNLEKELAKKQTNFEFECYTRDKMIAQDEKNLRKFLAEQKRDKEMDREYESQEYRGPPVDHSKQIVEQHENFAAKEKEKQTGYYKRIDAQAKTQKDLKLLNKAAEKELAKKEKGFEFECFTRDKMVAQDEKALKKFLAEQKKDKELDREYQAVEERGTAKPDDTAYLYEMQAQRLKAEAAQKKILAADNIERETYNKEKARHSEDMQKRDVWLQGRKALDSMKEEREWKAQQRAQYAAEIKQQMQANSSPYK